MSSMSSMSYILMQRYLVGKIQWRYPKCIVDDVNSTEQLSFRMNQSAFQALQTNQFVSVAISFIFFRTYGNTLLQ
jgi:hypothetical protein